ncbi:MAG: endopeptidase La, partial [Deltaproteobacteria bacterium]|nr:endopeptidase La [Deltaproteobacteria bacterium]
AEDPETIRESLDEVDDPDDLVDLAAGQLDLDDEAKLALLTEIDILERVGLVLPVLSHKHEVVLRKAEIHDEVVDETARSTREMLLRDRMRAIREELGESDETEVEELRTKVLESKMPDAARQAALKQLRRMADMSSSSAEYNIANTYVNWLLDVPFGRIDKDTIDVQGARAILDADHAGLERVKKRIVEFIAVRKLAPDKRGPILCFVGPPGVGKTSLARSIATALGREYVRISLGGVRDDAEIRGHRRTYVGALPGRIISGLKKAGSMNPVFVLDELDKLSANARGGDPASAMLEVLDPEQNKEFVDHYVEVPVDVSKVMFIATANGLDSIPAPLRDRIEIIEITGYSEREKHEIARRHLLRKQLAEHGLEDDQLIMTDEAVDAVIDGYTREAGVRNLERELASVCRYAAVSITDGAESPIHVDAANLEEILGPRKFIHEAANLHPEVGVVTGLSWTPVGGKVLFLEAKTMPGKGKIRVTGQLGDIMMESAQTALSWVKSNAQRLGIDLTILDKLDLHVHAPEGAVKKDGPSAGVAMAIALTSVFTGKPARAKVAVTGEITLRGRVLPVGGIKSKLLAAHRAGVKTVLIPERNQKDLPEVPESVLADLEVIPISRVGEAIERALASDDEPTTVPPDLGGGGQNPAVARS